jgi:uncharacterized coiled-coil protein SlyX
MSEERGISMSEFKTVVESFKDGQKKIIEVMNHRFDKLEGTVDKLENRMDGLEGRMDRMEKDHRSMKEQMGLILEVQTEIKTEFKNKVDRDEFSKLEKRVARLERKVA